MRVHADSPFTLSFKIWILPCFKKHHRKDMQLIYFTEFSHLPSQSIQSYSFKYLLAT